MGMMTGAMALPLPGIRQFVASIALPMAPMYFVNQGINHNLERQRAMQSVAMDIDQYRDNDW
jgi:hypothetical protein